MAVLASFKAGKLVLDGKLLKPDTRRGLVALVQVCGRGTTTSCTLGRAATAWPVPRWLTIWTGQGIACMTPPAWQHMSKCYMHACMADPTQGDEGLVHLQWSERPAQGDTPGTSPEDDIVVFPEECSLAQVRPGTSSGCCYRVMVELWQLSPAALLASAGRIGRKCRQRPCRCSVQWGDQLQAQLLLYCQSAAVFNLVLGDSQMTHSCALLCCADWVWTQLCTEVPCRVGPQHVLLVRHCFQDTFI